MAIAIALVFLVVAISVAAAVPIGDTLAYAPDPVCPSGAPAPQFIAWDVLYRPTDKATNLHDVSMMTSQRSGVAYDQGGIGGGYRAIQFGLWPVCNDPRQGCQNGGLPQNVSLPAHVAALEHAVDAEVPASMRGVIILDYEGWAPVWDDELGAQYKTMSEQIVRNEHPSFTPAEVTAAA